MTEKKSYDTLLLLVTLLLCAFGIVAIFSASTEVAYNFTGNKFYFLIKQVIFFFVGLFVLLLAAKVPLTMIQSFTKLFLLGSFVLLILVFFIGKNVKGATRWIDFGFANLHPASISQLAFILFLSDFLARRHQDINDFKRVIPVLVILGVFCILIALEPDFSTAMMLATVAFIMLISSGIKFKYLVFIIFSGVGFAAPVLLIKSYRITRIINWMKGADVGSLAGNYQSSQSLLSFGIGGFSGVGIGQSKQKYFFLPEAHTDYILAIIGEETGFIGTSIVLSLFFFFIWRGLKIAKNTTNLFHYYLATGLTCYIGLYAFVNTLVVLGVLPTTGLPLPFLSYGGSQLIISLLCVGLLLNISSYNNKKVRSD